MIDFQSDDCWGRFYNHVFDACLYPHEPLPEAIRDLVLENLESFKASCWDRVQSPGCGDCPVIVADSLLGVAMTHYLRASGYGFLSEAINRDAKLIRMAGFGQYLAAWVDSMMETFDSRFPGISECFMERHSGKIGPRSYTLRRGYTYVLQYCRTSTIAAMPINQKR